MSIYPSAIDGFEQLPLVVDGVTKVNAITVNALREAILNIENELGVTPSDSFGDVAARLADFETRISELEDAIEDLTVGGGIIPSGTGFVHITSDSQDAAAKLVENADVHASAAIAESKLVLNFATHSNANDPTSGQKAALVGTSGSPGAGNPYVTTDDARLDEFTISQDGLVPSPGSTTGLFLQDDGTWASPGGSGDVVGPGSATDHAVARFDLTTGKLIQNSTVIVGDTGNVTGLGTLNTHTVPGGTGTIALTSDLSSLVTGPASATDNAVARYNLTTGKLVQDSVVTIADTTGNMAGVGTLNTHTIPGGTGTIALTSDIPSAYTDELAQDAVGNIMTDTATIDFIYTDVTPTITADVKTNSISNSLLAQVSTQTFKGRTTASTGNVEDLTVTQATALLNNVVGDSGSGGTKGLVPAPAAGDASAAKFLKADGTWTTPTGSGDVVGPASATDHAVARFDLTTGKLIQDSVVTIADTTGNMAGVGTLNTHTIPGGTGTFALTSDITGSGVRLVYTYQPGGTPDEANGLYDDFDDLYTDALAVAADNNLVTIIIDNTEASPAVIPDATYDLQNMTLIGIAAFKEEGFFLTAVETGDTVFNNWTTGASYISLEHTGSAPLSTLTTFAGGHQFRTGFRSSYTASVAPIWFYEDLGGGERDIVISADSNTGFDGSGGYEVIEVESPNQIFIVCNGEFNIGANSFRGDGEISISRGAINGSFNTTQTNHSGDLSISNFDPDYTPGDVGNWDNVPALMSQALDELALVTASLGGATGDVDGPASATTQAIAIYADTTGKLLKNSVVTVADTTGHMAGVGTLNTHTIPGGTGTIALTSSNARVDVKKAGVSVGVRRGINFIDGTNVTITVTDDGGNEEVDVTINSTGGFTQGKAVALMSGAALP